MSAPEGGLVGGLTLQGGAFGEQLAEALAAHLALDVEDAAVAGGDGSDEAVAFQGLELGEAEALDVG